MWSPTYSTSLPLVTPSILCRSVTVPPCGVAGSASKTLFSLPTTPVSLRYPPQRCYVWFAAIFDLLLRLFDLLHCPLSAIVCFCTAASAQQLHRD
jgi:hypothetical protein